MVLTLHKHLDSFDDKLYYFQIIQGRWLLHVWFAMQYCYHFLKDADRPVGLGLRLQCLIHVIRIQRSG